MLEKYAQRLVSGPKMPPIQRENARPFKTRFYKDMSASLLSRITLSRHFWFWKHRRVPGHAFRKKDGHGIWNCSNRATEGYRALS